MNLDFVPLPERTTDSVIFQYLYARKGPKRRSPSRMGISGPVCDDAQSEQRNLTAHSLTRIREYAVTQHDPFSRSSLPPANLQTFIGRGTISKQFVPPLPMYLE